MRAVIAFALLLASLSANAAIQLYTNVAPTQGILDVSYSGTNTEPCCDYLAVDKFSMQSLISHPNLPVPIVAISNKLSPSLNPGSGQFWLTEYYYNPCVGGPYTAYANGFIFWDEWVQSNPSPISSIVRQGTKTCYC